MSILMLLLMRSTADFAAMCGWRTLVCKASDEPLALGGGQHSEDLGEGDSYSSDSVDAEWLMQHR